MPVSRDDLEQLLSFCYQQEIIDIEIIYHDTDLVINLCSEKGSQDLDGIFNDISSVDPSTGYYYVEHNQYDELYARLSSIAFNAGLTFPQSRVLVRKRFLEDEDIIEQQAKKRPRTISSSLRFRYRNKGYEGISSAYKWKS